MAKVCLVGGTWSYRSNGGANHGEWWQPDSAFSAFLRAREVYPVGQRPFVWTSSIGGLLSLRHGGRFVDWSAGGEALRNYFETPTHPDCWGNVPYEQRRIVAHSHGGEVALFAAMLGLRIHTLITVGTPVREDMRNIVEQARPRIGYWLHITDPSFWRNKMQWFGELFDGHLGIRWNQPAADLNCQTPHIGHSDILEKSALFPLWLDNGWLDILKREAS